MEHKIKIDDEIVEHVQKHIYLRQKINVCPDQAKKKSKEDRDGIE